MKALKMDLITLTAFLLLNTSCSNDDSEALLNDSIPFQELYDQGIDKYLGNISPISTESIGGGVMEYSFSSEDGPVCFTGNEFSMFTRDGSGNNLLIFLQGGGLCTPISCEALEDGIPLFPFGILNPQDSQSPTFGYDVGYLPYCDGSLWMGDGDADSNGDGDNDRFFRGLQNLSASLDVIFATYPSPDKIVLAGNSAGGTGVHAALPLVRKLYPDIRIDVINDSGIGIGAPGGFSTILNYWRASAFIPASCSDCIGSDGNLTGYHQYQLSQDQNIRMAYISSKQDATASAALGATAYEAQLIEAAAELKAAFPDRFNSLIPNGDEHTFLISNFDYQIVDITVKEWVSDMINETEDWKSVLE